MNKTITRAGLILVLVCLLFLTSCVPVLSTNSVLQLSPGEKWSLKINLIVQGQDPTMKVAFETGLGQSISQLQEQGLTAEWEQQPDETNLAYEIILSGSGYNTLNQAVFGGQAAITPGPKTGQVVFNYTPTYGSWFLLGNSNSFTLKAGKVISSNGVTRGAMVVWTNPPGSMTATVSVSSNTVLYIAIGVFLALGLLFLAIGASRRKQQARQGELQEIYSTSSEGSVRYCMFCGLALPDKSVHCPYCGRKNE